MQSAKRLLVILDPGHGGILNGKYQTAGKQWKHPDGTQIFEGKFNREVADRIAKLLEHNPNIDYAFTVQPTDPTDVTLGKRCRTANDIHRQQKGNYDAVIFCSVHGNAFDPKPTANGWCVYTTPGQTKADKVAELLYLAMEEQCQGRFFRADKRDGDHDYEEQFYVLKHTAMPAVLTENFFMTNLDDCKFMLSEDGQNKIATAHASAFEQYRLTL